MLSCGEILDMFLHHTNGIEVALYIKSLSHNVKSPQSSRDNLAVSRRPISYTNNTYKSFTSNHQSHVTHFNEDHRHKVEHYYKSFEVKYPIIQTLC